MAIGGGSTSRVTFSSLGAFDDPGFDQSTEGGEYIAERGSGQWALTPMNPPADQFQPGLAEVERASHESLDFSADLSESLFLAAPLEAKPVAADFFRRDKATGALRLVGPLLSPEEVAEWTPAVADVPDFPATVYAGASEDLSHILFSQLDRVSFNWLWPGDSTVNGLRSLYQYVGLGNTEPELVGVKNAGSIGAMATAEHKAHINEAAELVSECGTFLGSGQGAADTYGAISQSGETIFFTPDTGACGGLRPAVEDVYARVDRDATVNVAAPTKADCAECDLSEVEALKFNGREFEGTPTEQEEEAAEAVRLRATFQGASTDGRRVFFISARKIFGGADQEAGTNLYEYDFAAPAGAKVVLVAHDLTASAPAGEEPQPGGVVRVAEDGSRTYFVSSAELGSAAPNEFGSKAELGANNLYVYETTTRVTKFIGKLSAEDHRDWLAVDERPVDATPNGRFLLFRSSANLTSDSTGESFQLYRYDDEPASESSPRLQRVSAGAPGAYECPVTKSVEVGFNCDGNNAASPVNEVFSPSYARKSKQRFVGASLAARGGVAITSDGSKVFFESPAALAPGALNDVCAFESSGACRAAAHNVYEWSEGTLYLISDGIDSHSLFSTSATQLLGADESGSDVYMISGDRLVPQDTDNQTDIYDARENGGFPAPTSTTPCEGDGCRSAAYSAPKFGSPASTSESGASNLTPTTSLPVKKSSVSKASRGKLLARALRQCLKRSHRMRAACRKRARRRYGAPRSRAKSQSSGSIANRGRTR
jgi:hypothetical protein